MRLGKQTKELDTDFGNLMHKLTLDACMPVLMVFDGFGRLIVNISKGLSFFKRNCLQSSALLKVNFSVREQTFRAASVMFMWTVVCLLESQIVEMGEPFTLLR